MQALFERVRAECDSATWSRGVSLARAGSVVGESADDTQVVLRVSAPRTLVAPTVSLYPDDEEWECDCSSPSDPCDHVAAAVIALRQARQDGRDLPGSDAQSARVGYRFTRRSGALAFDRVVVTASGEQPLAGSLAALAAGAGAGPSIIASSQDVRVERRLGSRLRGIMPEHFMPDLLRALAGSEEVCLDGEPVAVSTEAVLPRIVLEERGDGYALELAPSADVEVFRNGVARCEGTLRPVGDPRLSLREREQLTRGRLFRTADEVGLLLSQILPDLEARVPVEIRSTRLPRSERIPPRLHIDTERRADTLVVRGEVVYGDPVCARVEAGRLIHIGGPVPQRDLAAESRLRVRLQRGLGFAPGQEVALEGAAAIALAERLRDFDAATRGTAHEAFYAAPELVARLAVESGFDLGFESATPRGVRRVGADAVLRAWREGREWVALEGGGFAPLPTDWLARYGEQVADLLAARGEAAELPASVLPDLARLCAELDLPPPPRFERLRALLDGFRGLPDAPLPDDLQAELRPYQKLGVRWLVFLRDTGLGGLLADDMGLGKTLQALCALRGRTLVVAPTSVLHGWVEQARRFRPGLSLSIYHGPGRVLVPDADVTLTTYAILRLDAAQLAEVVWDTLVLDESQAIKNPDSQVARAARGLRGAFRLTLTGTPVENRLEELWSQLSFTNPGLLGGRRDFEQRYARPIAAGSSDAAERLRARIAPFVLRRRKADVAPELPPRTEVELRCDLGEEERAVYDAVRAATRSQVVERLRAGGGVIEALEALLRLRQAACHPSLVPGQSAQRSAKLELLIETLEQAVSEGHKALVFSQWTSLLDLVEPELANAGLDFTRLDGSTRDRAGVVAGFQDADGPPVMLISLRAGGTGLNLTAADHVFLLDPWWNPAVESQAADRAHRIGQERPVFVHRLVARDTVEERILALQQKKREIAELALEGSGRAASISRDELLALLD